MQNPGRWTWGGRNPLRWLLLAVVVVLPQPHQAAAQNSTTWGWGRQQQVFDPDLFADYLLSGQSPHPAVARIIAPEQEGVSLGSGVLVDSNTRQGLVLTNWHVIRDSRSAVLVQFPDGFQSAGTVVRFDEAWDLAAISIWKPPATPLPLASRNPVPGELLSIAGYGRGSYRAQTGRCTEYLSPGSGYPRELVELAAPARQGDSGGPILDASGRLAGVLFGEGEGRTVGSCVSRLRVFLASVGSDGYEPVTQPVATTRAATQPIAAAASQPSEAASSVSSSSRGPRVLPAGVSLGRSPVAGPTQATPPPADATVTASPGWLAAGEIAIPAEVLAHFNVFTNGQNLLTAAGGLSLVLIGLRLILKSRQ
jgi:hypothetical protein